MSAFCVFGMTDVVAKQLANKSYPPLSQRKELTPEQLEEWRKEKALEILKSGRVRQVSTEFCAPQFCNDWIALAKRQVKTSRLKIMVRGVKTDKKGAVVISKRTKQPMQAWVPYEA